jgi:hypothetical protein
MSITQVGRDTTSCWADIQLRREQPHHTTVKDSGRQPNAGDKPPRTQRIKLQASRMKAPLFAVGLSDLFGGACKWPLSPTAVIQPFCESDPSTHRLTKSASQLTSQGRRQAEARRPSWRCSTPLEVSARQKMNQQEVRRERLHGKH